MKQLDNLFFSRVYFGIVRDVNFTRLHEFPRVKPVTGQAWGEDFALRIIGMGILNIHLLNRVEAWITISVLPGTCIFNVSVSLEFSLLTLHINLYLLVLPSLELHLCKVITTYSH